MTLLLLAWTSTGFAAEPAHAAGGEGVEAAHEAEGHGEHHAYTADDDHDGTPNWRDPRNGDVDNEDTYILGSVGFHGVNLALLVGVLAYFGRRPIADSFRERALTVRNTLTDSARRRDEAHQKQQELVARLERIESEIQEMEREAATEAAREEQKLMERARREGARILEQAERNIRDETKRARIAVRSEAIALAVTLAQDALAKAVTPVDQNDLARDFLDNVKERRHV